MLYFFFGPLDPFGDAYTNELLDATTEHGYCTHDVGKPWNVVYETWVTVARSQQLLFVARRYKQYSLHSLRHSMMLAMFVSIAHKLKGCSEAKDISVSLCWPGRNSAVHTLYPP